MDVFIGIDVACAKRKYLPLVICTQENGRLIPFPLASYPTGKIYIGKDLVGSFRYFGSPNIDIINEDFKLLPRELQLDYSVRKQILWESEDCSNAVVNAKEVEFIRKYDSNNPAIGYNRWPKFRGSKRVYLLDLEALCQAS